MKADPIPPDDAGLKAALVEGYLPVDDLLDGGGVFFRFRDGERVVGYGAFELYGDKALLRSIVVLPQARGAGAGRFATDFLMRRAYEAGARHAYLLTISADAFFEKAGFRPIDRATAPADILSTRQATALCPASATLLFRELIW